MQKLFLLLATIQATFAFSQDTDADKKAKSDAFNAAHINYVREATGRTDNFKALLIGSAVTTGLIDSSYVIAEYERLEAMADCIVVGSEEVGKLVSDYSGLPYYVAQQYCDEAFGKTGSSEYFMFISTKGGEISRYISAITLKTVVTPRKHHGKKSDPDFFCYPETLLALLDERKDAKYLFVDDIVNFDSVVNSTVSRFWERIEKKADVVVVFSEKMRKAVVSRTSLKVVLSERDYDHYFVEPESYMKKWLWFELKDEMLEGVIASPRSIDLVRRIRPKKGDD